jgi:hypothetical protein
MSSAQVASDEKVSPVMLYTQTHLFWGDLVTKEVIRVSTWLRTISAPDHVQLFNAKAIFLNGMNQPKPILQPTLFVPTPQIIAYHLIPPSQDPLDYDPHEAARKLIPVNIFCGPFMIKGKIRIASISNLAKYMEINREQFSSVYEAEISHPGYSALGAMRVPFILIRQAVSVYSDQVG